MWALVDEVVGRELAQPYISSAFMSMTVRNSMDNNTSVLFGQHNVFNTGSATGLVDAIFSPLWKTRLGFYVAVGCILLAAYFIRGNRVGYVDAPFYKAAKSQWFYEADTLVRDSYDKVGTIWRCLSHPSFSSKSKTNIRYSSETEYTKLGQQKGSKSSCRPSLSGSSRCCRKIL